MACETEKQTMDQIKRQVDEKNEDFWWSMLGVGAGSLGTIAAVANAVITSPTGVGAGLNTTIAISSGLSTIKAFRDAGDAWDDYEVLEHQYFTACKAYRDCLHGRN